MKKIIMCGSKGKTGSVVYELLQKEGYEILDCVNENEMTLYEAIKKHQQIDYVIDFTIKKVAYLHILLCLEYHIPFICGTTGFNSQELNAIKEKCKEQKLKGIICSNFSLPLNCIIKEINQLSRYFEQVKIIEQHHLSKKDKPSGTGKLLLSLIDCKKEIQSLEREDFVIQYDIQFLSKCDKMNITYVVDSKEVYAKGVLDYLQHEQETHFKNLIQY